MYIDAASAVSIRILTRSKRFLFLSLLAVCGSLIRRMTRSVRKSTLIVAVCTVILVGLPVNGKSPADWRSRVVYQILTDRFAKTGDAGSPCQDLSDFCGGNFRGIIEKLDYIQGLGVNAIWISPIPEQTDKGYHGYWQKNLNNINQHFGTSSDLQQLVSECHQRDIWVMLDIVANHMGNQPTPDKSDFSMFFPFNKPEHYNEYCEIEDSDWETNQAKVESCRLAGLPDLNQSDPFVRSTLNKWIHDTVQTYGFDGIRVDTVREVPKDFWVEYCQAAGVYSIGEVFHQDKNYVAGYQGALSALLNYPMYYKLKDIFLGQDRKSMHEIRTGITENRQAFQDTTVLGNFLDNHDNPRFLSGTDKNIMKNGLAYVIFAEGIPFIYYGTEQGYNGGGDPSNRESLWPNYNTDSDLYKFISTLAKFRREMGPSLYESEQVERFADDHLYAFTRGDKGEVFVAITNIGAGQSLTRTISYHPYPIGTVLVNIFDPNNKITVTKDGFTIAVNDGLPLVYTPAKGGHEEL